MDADNIDGFFDELELIGDPCRAMKERDVLPERIADDSKRLQRILMLLLASEAIAWDEVQNAKRLVDSLE